MKQDNAYNESCLSFVELTGCTLDKANSYISMANGDLQLALELFFQNEGVETEEETPIDYDNPISPLGIDMETNRFAFATSRKRQPNTPPHRSVDEFSASGFTRNFFSPERHSVESRSLNPFLRQNAKSTDDQEHVSKLENLFRPPTEIIFKGSLEIAKENGRMEKKWILVDLQDETEFRCLSLNRDIWKSPNVQTFVVENFLFLQLSVNFPHGLNYLNLYPFPDPSSPLKFPHVSILDPRTGERMLIVPPKCLTDVDSFISVLFDFIENHRLDAPNISNDVPSLEQPLVAEKDPQENFLSRLKPFTAAEPKSGLRIQFRMPNGSRKVRSFDPNTRVFELFGFVKFSCLDQSANRFSISFLGECLSSKLNHTLEEAGLANASLQVTLENLDSN